MTTETMLLMIRVTAIGLFSFWNGEQRHQGIEMFTFYIPFSKKMAQNGASILKTITNTSSPVGGCL